MYTYMRHNIYTSVFVYIIITGTHLGSCHNLQQPRTVEPAEKGDKEQSRNSSKVAGVEEREGHAQKPCAQAHVDHHDVAEKGTDGLLFASHGSLKQVDKDSR